jgi:hypothetical protein
MNTISRVIVSATLILSAVTSYAGLITSSDEITDQTVIDFSTQPTVSDVDGPIQIGDAVGLDISVDGNPTTGFYTNYDGWGLCDNGNWVSPMTYISANDARPGSILVSFNDGPVSAVGGFMNHALGCNSGSPFVINVYDSGMNLLESHDITADAVTPSGTNEGIFRGISRPSAEIAYFEVLGYVPVLDDLTIGGATVAPAAPAVPVPTLNYISLAILILLLGSVGLFVSRRT